MDNKTIERLIERYMAGQTSIEEERRLEEALRTSGDKRWDDYRRMFDFIEQGCTTVTKPRRRTGIIGWIATGAAAAVVAVSLLMSRVPSPTDTFTPIDPLPSLAEADLPKPLSATTQPIETEPQKPATRTIAAPRSETGLIVQEAAEPAAIVDKATDEIDLSRYIAMTVDTEPEVAYTEAVELDEDELINRCIDAQLRQMEQHTRGIEYIATAIQRQDEAAFELLTRDF